MGVDIAVLLGSRARSLAAVPTRWHQVLLRWSREPAIDRLTLIDWPAMSPKHLPRATSSRLGGDWLEGRELIDVSVPVIRGRSTPLDPLAWRATASLIDRRLGRSADRLVVATTPLSIPLAAAMGARRRVFDAYDDWRALPSVSAVRPRIVTGYRAASELDGVSFGTTALAATLGVDFGLGGTVIPNGVTLPPVVAGAPDGLPDEPFAVYVGVIQSRVDLELLAAVAAALPVVVAGPADEPTASRLRSSGVRYLGPVPPAEVPGLLAAAAVGLLPHHDTALTRSMDPLKFLEYLAAGLPVVATPVGVVAELAAITPSLVLASGPVAFAAAAAAAARVGARTPAPEWLARRNWDLIAHDLLEIARGGSP